MNKYQKQKARSEAIKRTKEHDDCVTLYEIMGYEKALEEIYRKGGVHCEERKETDINEY